MTKRVVGAACRGGRGPALRTSVLAVSIGLISPVHAAEQFPSTDMIIEDVVVTARKREERLTDVPFSLQVVGSEELSKLGAVNFADYARTVAGVQFEDKGAGRANIFIRGVSTGGDVDTGKQSTVGVYFDETPVSESSSQPDLKLFDIERIEILRGAQGTLFGSASLSGTLRILPKQPDLTKLEGFAQAQVSNTQHGGLNDSVNAMVNVPLAQRAALRVVGYHVYNEGFLTNGFSGADNINDERSNGGRMALLLQPNDAFDVTLSGIYQRSRFGAYYQATDHHPELIIDQAEPETFIDRYAIGAAKANYEFGGARLTSVSSLFDRKRYFRNDIDYFTGLLGVPRAFSPLTYTSKTFTQELRLASSGERRLNWLVGAYFEDREESATQSISPAGEPVPPPAQQLAHIHRDANTQQYAGFGEASYDMTEKLTVTAGVRASVIESDNTSVNDGILFGGQTVKTGDNRDTPISPRFIVSYRPYDGAELYAQASRGFRIGGVNPGLPPCDPANGCTVDVGSTFDPDTVWNYEIGLKLQVLDQRLSLDADVFWIDWDDIQVNVGRGDGFNGFMNGGSAVSRGVELAATAQLNANVRIGGQFTYTQAYLTSLAAGVAEAGVAEVDDDLPQIPPISTSGYVEWGMGFAGDGWFYVRGDVQYVDRRFSGFTSNEPRELPSYTLANLRLGLDKGPYSAAIFVNNVADKRAILSDQSYSGVHDGQPYAWERDNINIPRTIGMSLARRF